MNINEITNELEKVENRYKDKMFPIGELNIYLMAKTCKYKIQDLQQENQQLKEKYKKALELLTKYNLPCEIDDFNTKEENLDYCSKNCSVDEDIYLKCWDRFIEQVSGSAK